MWSLAGRSAITSRVLQLTENCDDEVMLLVGNESGFSESIAQKLNEALSRDVQVYVGTQTGALTEVIQSKIPDTGGCNKLK